MKKSILTIAFVSFALVATSFTTVEASNSSSVTMDPPPTAGQCVGCGTKKLDVTITDNSNDTNSIQLKGFASDNQSLESTKKLD